MGDFFGVFLSIFWGIWAELLKKIAPLLFKRYNEREGISGGVVTDLTEFTHCSQHNFRLHGVVVVCRRREGEGEREREVCCCFLLHPLLHHHLHMSALYT